MRGAEDAIGRPVEHGCLVNPRGGAVARVAGAAAGEALGSAAKVTAEMAAERAAGSSGPLPSRAWSAGFLAVAGSDLVLVEAKTGLVGPKAGEVLARVDRGMVGTVALAKGTLLAPLTIAFRDGSTWELSVPRAQVKRARQLAAALTP